MPIDDDTKVFDVARPSQSHPDATSRPVIVGHRPEMSDPMVKESEALPTEHDSTPIHVAMADEDTQGAPEHSPTDGGPSISDESPSAFSSLMDQHQQVAANHDAAAHEVETVPEEPQPAHQEQQTEQAGEQEPQYTPLDSLIPTEQEEPDRQQKQFDSSTTIDNQPPETKPLHIPHGAGPRKRWPKVLAWLLVLLILVIVGGYLAIDAGLVSSNIKLPFHIFNQQKTSSSQTTATSSPPPAVKTPTPTPSVPAGFTAYTLTGTAISFDYPTTWGSPSVTADLGYSKRGGANKSDGTYAYLINFATNKDVQVAVTSAKYLPAARTQSLYYDDLQWCTGTNDGKTYLQQMIFTNTNGIYTPGTIACTLGPLAGVTKIDDQTIAQLKTNDITNNGSSSPPGASQALTYDLYTKNLSSADWSVLRVKDNAMTNGDNIKTLLTTVKVNSASSSSGASGTSGSSSTSTP